MILAGFSRLGPFVSLTNPSVCCARRATRFTSSSAMERYCSARPGSLRARYSRLSTASSGLLISCATEAARRPAVASFSLRRIASSDCFRAEMSRAIADAPTIPPFAFRSGETVSTIGTRVPSLRIRSVW